jgi:hypothetical protein
VGGGERPGRPYVARLTRSSASPRELDAVDARVRAEVDAATESPRRRRARAARRADGIYADPPGRAPALVPRGRAQRGRAHERAEGWGHVDARRPSRATDGVAQEDA